MYVTWEESPAMIVSSGSTSMISSFSCASSGAIARPSSSRASKTSRRSRSGRAGLPASSARSASTSCGTTAAELPGSSRSGVMLVSIWERSMSWRITGPAGRISPSHSSASPIFEPTISRASAERQNSCIADSRRSAPRDSRCFSGIAPLPFTDVTTGASSSSASSSSAGPAAREPPPATITGRSEAASSFAARATSWAGAGCGDPSGRGARSASSKPPSSASTSIGTSMCTGRGRE
ncbi:Uncharacterised protein [Mycobacteroides abscessus subsp. abscessus]|nr:Uncharacterised protein [Mycobacteroides abscessus subsp. abscessus]